MLRRCTSVSTTSLTAEKVGGGWEEGGLVGGEGLGADLVGGEGLGADLVDWLVVRWMD